MIPGPTSDVQPAHSPAPSVAPIVRGEERTTRQMPASTNALGVASLISRAPGKLGGLYGAVAVVLRARLLRAILVLRGATALPAAARPGDRTSLVYLALPFIATAVDVALHGRG